MSILRTMMILTFILLSTKIFCGCSANHYSIHRIDRLNLDESQVIAVDAKQRFLLTDSKPAGIAKDASGASMTTERIRRFCAEPSPDVFSLLSQAATGSGSFGQTADPKALNVTLQAAFSNTETGSTISHTQTVNMLKEMMYRTCERYLNGQISDIEYPIIAARDQRIMTSILAIEQLTGAVLPKAVVIAATGNASTGQPTNDNKKKDKVEEGKDSNALKNASKPGVSAVTSSTTTSSLAAAGIDKQIEQNRYQVAQYVANVVKEIVALSFAQTDETSFFCYRALEKNFNKELSDSCLTFLTTKVESETDRLRLETEETAKQMRELRESSFDKFWDKVKTASGQVDKKKLSDRIDNKFPVKPSKPLKDKLDEMKRQSTAEEIRKIFNSLHLWVINKLIED